MEFKNATPATGWRFLQGSGTDPMFVIPYGVEAEIDCKQETFTITENAVVED